VCYTELAYQVFGDIIEDVQSLEGHVLRKIFLDWELQVGNVEALELPARIHVAGQIDQPASGQI
jgi:hypothetical protein